MTGPRGQSGQVADLPLRRIALDDDRPTDGHPWDVPAVASLGLLEFPTPVTLLVGENGTGKSTLIEAIAIAVGLNPEGGTRHLRYSARSTESPLADHIRPTWGSKPRHAFFLRAETFFNMATEYEDPELGSSLNDLHVRSHGQQFLAAVREHFGPGGLFVMDEPESALSFTNQLALMRVMHDLAAQGSQFILATHSPVLATYPGSTVYELDRHGLERVDWDRSDTYMDVRNYLEAPERYLRVLFEEN